MTTAHLDVLRLHLSNERSRLASSTTDAQKAYRMHLIAIWEREIAGEMAFLGITEEAHTDLSDEELLAELMAGAA